MADVLTNRLRITKPDVGGSDDTWGSKLNTDWDIADRVYRDMAGALVSSTFGSANAHEVTLTHTDYADIDSTLGFRIALRSGATNTGAMTLDVLDGNGARPVRKGAYGATDVFGMQELAAGDFPEYHVGDFIYVRRSGFSGWVMTNPARGGIPNATTTVRGIVELATDAEAQLKADTTKAITPKNLASLAEEIIPDATTTVKGKVELATADEVQTGTDTVRAVTPASLLDSTTIKRGLVELATAAELETGTDAVRAVTPASIPYADTVLRGLVRLATNAETIAGTDTVNVITPSRLQAALNDHAPNATTAEAGIVQLATGAEALDGTVTNKAITPFTLEYVDTNRAVRTANQLCAHGNLVVTRTGTDTVHVVASSVMLYRSDAAVRRFTGIVETANINTLGAGGRDTGAVNNDAWYSIWIIATETGTISSLLSLEDGGTGVTGGAPSSPTMPSGYVYRGYVGSVRNSGGSFVNFHQNGNVARINGPALACAVADNEWTKVGNFGSYVPPEALSAHVTAFAQGAAAAVLAVRLAPTATLGTTGVPALGETLLQGIGSRSSQATITLSEAQTLYVRLGNTAAGTPITDCDVYVNGYTL